MNVKFQEGSTNLLRGYCLLFSSVVFVKARCHSITMGRGFEYRRNDVKRVVEVLPHTTAVSSICACVSYTLSQRR